tara:strand:+ start:278 stop:463 length:186 start_codon:yes stop_codon:yes gene_type:complete
LLAVIRASFVFVVGLQQKVSEDKSGKIGNTVPTDATGTPTAERIWELPEERVQVMYPIFGK